MVVLADVVLVVSHGCTTVKAIITSFWSWWRAVLAEVVVSASAVDQVVSNVLLARAVGDTVLECVLIDQGRVTTIAAAASLAVNDRLSVETDWSCGLETA